MVLELDLNSRKTPQEKEILLKVEPVVNSMGYDLRDLEILGSGRSPLVRVTLDRKSPEDPAIGIEDCSKVHQMLNPMFDVWDPFPGNYTLEVSSPGESPILRTLKHFKEALGKTIRIQTIEAIPMPPPAKARKNWEGLLQQIEEAPAVKLELEDSLGKHWIPLEMIKMGQWVQDWSPVAPKPKSKKLK